MSEMMPTATTCSNGKRHRWQVITVSEYGREHIWCARCGAYSERVDGRRCQNTDGSTYVEIPENAIQSP